MKILTSPVDDLIHVTIFPWNIKSSCRPHPVRLIYGLVLMARPFSGHDKDDPLSRQGPVCLELTILDAAKFGTSSHLPLYDEFDLDDASIISKLQAF